MSTSSFAWPVPLPVFIGGERKPFDVWANGLVYGDQSYDGFTNKVEITPLVRMPGLIFPTMQVGQCYTIGESHLRRLICQSNPASKT